MIIGGTLEPAKNSCTTCAGLIRLCAGLDFFPVDPAIHELLVERLHRLAKDHGHARAMIGCWLDTETVAPKIADLVQLASVVPSPESPDGLPTACDTCKESGGYYVIVDYPHGLTAAARCTCARGQRLRERDEQHKYQRAA